MVGPKLVEWDDPRFLQSVGLSSDRMGVPVPLATAREYDQGQHDAVTEVLAVPSACMLIRTEVFDRLGGFDGAMTYHGEDLDIGRRANLAGETVLVAPEACVRHRARLAERRPRRDGDLLAFRHQLRSVLVCATGSRLAAEVPAMLALTGLEAALAVVTGEFRRAAALLGAWWWNLLGLSEIIARRRRIGEARDDARVDGLTGRGYVSLLRAVDRLVRGEATVEAAGVIWGRRRRLLDAVRDTLDAHGGPRLDPHGGRPRLRQPPPADARRPGVRRVRAAGGVAAGAVPRLVRQLAGGRAGIGGSGADRLRHPHRRELDPLGPDGAGAHRPGAGSGALRAAGLWRLLAPTGSRRAQIAGMAAFVVMPLPYNALANGVWSALAVYALVPWICLWLSRVAGPPTASSTPPPGRFLLPTLAIGVLVGLLGAFVPAAPLLVAMVVVALVAGGLLAGEARALPRLVGAALAGVIVGWLLNWPAAPTSLEALLATAASAPIPPPV